MSQKQLLVIDDLLTPQQDLEHSVNASNLDYEIIWKDENATPNNVEVIITVLKKLDKEYLVQYPNLKMVAVAFTGYDSVDMDFCNEHNIAVYNVPKYSTNSVAELSIGLTIATLREITSGNNLIREKGWTLSPGIELSGKTVGIVGTGEIGVTTAKLFKAFGCKLIGWSRNEKEEFKAIGGTYINDKQAFFAAADIVSVHLPLNNKTKGIISKEELSAMKQSAILINTARGAIIDEKKLIKALKQKQIAGAGLDVFEQEPINHNNELLRLDNVVLTPHVAYKTEEALTRRMEVTVKNIVDFRDGNKDNRVN